MKILKKLSFVLLFMFIFLTGCEAKDQYLRITQGKEINLVVGNVLQLTYEKTDKVVGEEKWTSSSEGVEVSSKGTVKAISEGTAKVYLEIGTYSTHINVNVSKKVNPQINLSVNKNSLTVGETTKFNVELVNITGEATITQKTPSDATSYENGILTALEEGESTYIAKIGDVESNPVKVVVSKPDVLPTKIEIFVNKQNLEVNEVASISYKLTPSNATGDISFSIVSGTDNAEITGNTVKALTTGEFKIVGTIGNITSNTVTINQAILTEDPYENVSYELFYENYKEATSYQDALYRKKYGFMSGAINEQDQAPIVEENRPNDNDVLFKNSKLLFSDDKNTYYIMNKDGLVVNEIYRDGGYTLIDEVAAYVLAFNDIPANYTQSKSTSSSSEAFRLWGKFLRVNHSAFSGSTSKYPFEPELPNISGCGGTSEYYELDIATTGTDCDPKYVPAIYNDGTRITRGAARIVYSRYINGAEYTDLSEKHVFYTYNHYNDFQEYLNYENGWGYMFGNITGGGQISSRVDYAPTPYISVTKKEFK